MDSRAGHLEDLPPLALRSLRDLDLDAPPSVGRPAHVSSTSGLVRRGDHVYVVGDELLSLACFRLSDPGPGALRMALAGELSNDPGERAGQKADLESPSTATRRSTSQSSRRSAPTTSAQLDGVEVTFSDASPLGDAALVFTASAEAQDDSDEIHGSVVGTIDVDGRVRRMRTIDRRYKVEGVHATLDTGVLDLLFVCDQDGPEVVSPPGGDDAAGRELRSSVSVARSQFG